MTRRLGDASRGEVEVRGVDGRQEPLFTVAKLEDVVPAEHPLREIRTMVNEALAKLNGLFNEIYADTGRASIAPERLLRALLLQVLYSIRSERMLVERMRYNLLLRSVRGPCSQGTVSRSRMISPMHSVSRSLV